MESKMETVQITLNLEIFEKLKQIAEPLVDDPNSVINRLIEHWMSDPPHPRKPTIILPEPSLPSWRSSRGEKFTIGTLLRASYRGHTFSARITPSGIEFDGKTYSNPSSAGIAAKKTIGVEDSAANTNGWSFWEMQEPDSNQWISINTVRYAKK
jgi:hypothetical protein